MRGEPLSRAEDEESRPAWATYQEAEARLTGNYCLGLKMGIKTMGRAGATISKHLMLFEVIQDDREAANARGVPNCHCHRRGLKSISLCSFHSTDLDRIR